MGSCQADLLFNPQGNQEFYFWQKVVPGRFEIEKKIKGSTLSYLEFLVLPPNENTSLYQDKFSIDNQKYYPNTVEKYSKNNIEDSHSVDKYSKNNIEKYSKNNIEKYSKNNIEEKFQYYLNHREYQHHFFCQVEYLSEQRFFSFGPNRLQLPFHYTNDQKISLVEKLDTLDKKRITLVRSWVNPTIQHYLLPEKWEQHLHYKELSFVLDNIKRQPFFYDSGIYNKYQDIIENSHIDNENVQVQELVFNLIKEYVEYLIGGKWTDMEIHPFPEFDNPFVVDVP